MKYPLRNDTISHLDSNHRDIFDEESLKDGQERIKEAFDRNDWMTPDKFGEYLKDELKRIYEK